MQILPETDVARPRFDPEQRPCPSNSHQLNSDAYQLAGPRADWEKAPALAASSGAESVQGSRRLGQVQRDLACMDGNDACAGPAGEPSDRRRCRRGP
jgi:hypothetical protein